MDKTKNNVLKLSVLTVYGILFYGIWTVWAFWGTSSITIENEYVSQFIKSGVVKNLVWTLPALLLIDHFKSDMYVGLKEMFTANVKLLKYLPIFLFFTAYLLIGAVITKGRLAFSETFGLSDLITVLFVGITEETVFRGWLLNATVSEKKKWAAVIINSLMFLLIHFPIWICSGEFITNFQNLGFLSVLILSMIFSLTFIKSKNILIPIFLHMYWDLLIFMLY